MSADTAYLASIAASLLEKQALPGSVEASRLRDAASVAYRQGQIMEQAQAQEQKQSSSPPTATETAGSEQTEPGSPTITASPSAAGLCQNCGMNWAGHSGPAWVRCMMASTAAPTPASSPLGMNGQPNGRAGSGSECAHMIRARIMGQVTCVDCGAYQQLVWTPVQPATETLSISQRPALKPSAPAETPAPSASSGENERYHYGQHGDDCPACWALIAEGLRKRQGAAGEGEGGMSGVQYHGYTYPWWLQNRVAWWLWKKLACPVKWHLWDEVGKGDRLGSNYLYCDACGVMFPDTDEEGTNG